MARELLYVQLCVNTPEEKELRKSTLMQLDADEVLCSPDLLGPKLAEQASKSMRKKSMNKTTINEDE